MALLCSEIITCKCSSPGDCGRGWGMWRPLPCQAVSTLNVQSGGFMLPVQPLTASVDVLSLDNATLGISLGWARTCFQNNTFQSMQRLRN